MSNKAGETFTCVCCDEPNLLEDALMNKDLQGPVCKPCAFNLKAAHAWLNMKVAGESYFGIHGCTHNQTNRMRRITKI